MKATATVVPPSPAAFRLSPWHTPVPYFFGGLAVLMGLIAFALLMLACSYGNLDGGIDNHGDGEGDQDRDLEAGDPKPDNRDEIIVFEEKFVVIMAGKDTPSFLATPVSRETTLFGGCRCICGSNLTEKSLEEVVEVLEEKEKERSGDNLQVRNT